jgi:hypothetical protein
MQESARAPLESLLDKARTEPPDRRIEFRDRIAAHGAEGIEGVRPWLLRPDLAAFAIRVIERAGANGEPVLAARVLRSARKGAPESVTGDIEWALAHIRLANRLAKQSAPAAAVVPAAPAVAARQERPHLSTVPRRRPR